MKDKASSVAFLCTMILCSAGRARAQACPKDDGSLMTPGQPTTVAGTIRAHGGLRPWIGLEVGPQVCGQHELQLTFVKEDSSLRHRQTDALAGCKVEVKGSIETSPTAHYSADMYIQDAEIVPDASCHPKPVSADPNKIPIPDLQSYRASIFLNFGETSKAIRGEASRSEGNTEKLTPWQNYIGTWLNGSEDLVWVSCRDGFQLTRSVAKVNGRAAPADLSLKGQAGLSAGEKPGPSSITITCVRLSGAKSTGASH